MVITRMCLIFIGLILLSTMAVTGQNQSEQYCTPFEDSVVKKINPTKVDRRDVYSDECLFEFTVKDNTDASLWIENNDTAEESHKSLNGYLYAVAFSEGLESEESLPLEKLEAGGCWDEAYFHKVNKFGSGFILLRKGNVAVTVLSQKDETLIEMEKLLRDEMGCKEEL